MKRHEVFFEIGGKKMRCSVVAKDNAEAKQKIYDKIIFHKIESHQLETDEEGIMKMFTDIFGTDLFK